MILTDLVSVIFRLAEVCSLPEQHRMPHSGMSADLPCSWPLLPSSLVSPETTCTRAEDSRPGHWAALSTPKWWRGSPSCCHSSGCSPFPVASSTGPSTSSSRSAGSPPLACWWTGSAAVAATPSIGVASASAVTIADRIKPKMGGGLEPASRGLGIVFSLGQKGKRRSKTVCRAAESSPQKYLNLLPPPFFPFFLSSFLLFLPHSSLRLPSPPPAEQLQTRQIAPFGAKSCRTENKEPKKQRTTR